MNASLIDRLVLFFRPHRVTRPLPGRVLPAFSVEAARDLLQHLQELSIEFQPLCRETIPPLLAALNAVDSTIHSVPREATRPRPVAKGERP